MSSLKDKTIFITGSSRGIGKAIALRAARDGANIVILGKTINPHPKLEGTIHTAAKEIEEAGGKALAIPFDVRNEETVQDAVEKTVETFGGIDILVNNASALHLEGTETMPMKRFDLIFDVNVRGTFLSSQKCLPYLKNSKNPHILNLSPPLNLDKNWFAPHVAYTISKYGMSMCALGMAEECKDFNIGVNCLWPKTTIATAAVKNILGGDQLIKTSRKPEIVADAAHWILTQDSKECTGNYFIDEDVLLNSGVNDLEKYSVTPGSELTPDLFI